jgi:hypothetical protein
MWRKHAWSCAVVAAVPMVLCAAPARSETPPALTEQGPRLRFGMGIISGAVDVQSPDGLPIATVFGVDLRLGIELNDYFAVMYEGSGTFLFPLVSNAIMVEMTPCNYFSLGVGGGVYWLLTIAGGGGGTINATSAGIPVRFAVNLPFAHSKSSDQRYAIAFSFQVTPAYAFAGSQSLGEGQWQVGFMGGISFEMY